MSDKSRIAFRKIRGGAWLMTRSFSINTEYMTHGLAMFKRGMAELFGVH